MAEHGPGDPTRRDAMMLAAAAATALTAAPAAAEHPPLADRIPIRPPTTDLAFEAVVDIAEAIAIGPAPLGTRRMVPITGGTFVGPRLRGVVLPGGADRQLLRADGVRQLEAQYELRTDDGAIITVTNHVVIAEKAGEPRYALSHIDLVAPLGPHDWLNQRVFVGTLDSLKPARAAVLVRVFTLTPGWVAA